MCDNYGEEEGRKKEIQLWDGVMEGGGCGNNNITGYTYAMIM